MAETTTYYDSALTGAELDEAFRNLGKLVQSVADAAQSAREAAFWADKASMAANGYLGYFATAEELRAAHPDGEAGQWAVVGSTRSVWFWDASSGAFFNTLSAATAAQYGTVRLSDTEDGAKAANDGWAASPAALTKVQNGVNSNANRLDAQESRVKSMNFMKPWDTATEQFLGEMGHGGAAADVTWERASDGADYLVFTVQGTRVCAIRGFCGINII